MNSFSRYTRMLTVSVALLSVGWFAIGIAASSMARDKRKEKEENYSRPKPTQPIQPTIPDVNRFQSDKVFLENADSLFRPQFDRDEKQIVKGNVKFRQGALWMFCDSAYYYPDQNSLDAFGHVEMRQGDTLFVYSDKLYYDGYQRKAILTKGPSRSKVRLKDPKMTLTTDSLDYDMLNERGWYTTGGKLEDEVNTLTSVYGEYSPATKRAEFSNDVLLVNRKDGFRMITDRLDYNTETNIADISTATVIEGANDTIHTTSGWYDTRSDNAELTSRSMIIHKDSAMNVTTLEGDSIIYDKATRISRAYMFRDPYRSPSPMILTDTAKKMILIGGYGEYNDSTKSAFATEYPLLIEFSRPDTLYLRADTIETHIRWERVWPEGYRIPMSKENRARLEALNSLQAIAETLNLTIKLLPDNMIQVDPDFEEPTPEELAAMAAQEQESADYIVATDSVSIADTVTIADTVSRIEGLPDIVVADSVVADSVIRLAGPRLDSLGRDSADMVLKEFRVAKAYRIARFFNQDLQGIADSMEYQEYDSVLYLFRKPVIWSGEREISGNRIDIHFNDSTVDKAFLPETGLMSEFIDEDFYNQLRGTEMTAYFKDKKLKHLYVEGNVESMFLPMEEDSTYNRIVNAESSYMTIDMTGNQMEKLKMWPEVSGTVAPLFLVTKNSQKYLEGFRPGMHDGLRPVREWYGDKVKWADDLGEVPEALEIYFQGSRTEKRSRKPRSPFAKPDPAPVAREEEVVFNSEGEVIEETPVSPEESEAPSDSN